MTYYLITSTKGKGRKGLVKWPILVFSSSLNIPKDFLTSH